MKPELLAPAGNMETLKAAILAGCDAVYIGGKFFGARNYADNFTDEEMIEAIKYAHLNGVKIYVTMNTLVYETETKNFIDYALFLHKNNVDAIIIQDIGMMDYLRQKYPNLKLHASTQMHIHNLEGVKLLENLGLERVVLARETSIDLIEQIKKETNIELEIFVQGALCISYSGQCLMSSLLNGRSGNRGTCSQCCRMPYDLIIDGKKVNQDNYLLSPKDLNTLKNLEPLLKLGVSSLKIEGRMKRKEYVYYVVSLYRKAIDSYFEKGYIEIKEEEIENLKKIFNRGFTKGFLNNEKSENLIHSYRPNHMGIEIGKVIDVKGKLVKIKLSKTLNQNDGIRIIGKSDTGCIINKLYKNKKLINQANPNDIVEINLKDKVNIGDKVLLTTDYNQIKELDNIIENEKKKIEITGSFKAKKNEFITLTVKDDKNEVTKEGSIPEKAFKTATSKDRIKSQLEKTGKTIFKFKDLDIYVDDDLFIRIDEINELRRKALLELEEKRYYKIPFVEKEYKVSVKEEKLNQESIYFIRDKKDYKKGKKYITDDINLYKELNDENVIFKLPRVNEKLTNTVDNLLVGELGSVYKYKNVVTDFSLNVVNSYSVAFLHSLGVKRVTLSYELNDYNIKKLIDAYKERYKMMPHLELIVDSTPEVMVLKYDILKKYNTNIGYLKDYQNHKYKIEKKDNLTTIYHYDKKKLENDYLEMGIEKLRYHLF